MYYYYQKNIFLELRGKSMMYYSANINHHIFTVKNLNELKQHLSKDPRFKIAFLTEQKKVFYASDPHKRPPFHKGFFEYENAYYYIDSIELEHLKEIRYIVIQANTIDIELEKTRQSIYIFLIFSILFLSAVIYVLSKLFLHPLRDAITKLDQFIRDTTHELNTPLSVITMSIEQLDKKTLDTRHLKHIDRIDVASRTISNLYNDLAFLIMYEQDQQHSVATIDLAALTDERIEYFRPIADAKKITFHTAFEPSKIAFDQEKMVRIIDNLLSNAIKYNKPSGNIYVSLTPESISVRDTGIGISSEKIDQIFNRYTRFDEANGGFGIGLNIIQMICKEYGFEIHVDSKIAQGTTFTISWKN